VDKNYRISLFSPHPAQCGKDARKRKKRRTGSMRRKIRCEGREIR
jgi:hypothetical protein